MKNHEDFIKRCLDLAAKAQGFVAPNPMVGAVLVYDGRIIGEGFHERFGDAHAEINCLRSVKDADKHLIPESTLYVNLEPCAHQGKTPPCAVRIVSEKIKHVIVCNKDPFGKVNGRGFQILEENNIATQSGILEENGLWRNRRFFCFHRQQRPYIILKWAQTQQGFFAPLNRTRFQMSNKHSQQLVHKWRTEESAVLVGKTTALQDDPQLTARLWQGKQPLRLVLDKNLELPSTLRIFNNDAPTWIVNNIKDAIEGNIRYVRLNFKENLIAQLLDKLHSENIVSLLVEGGAALLQSFIDERFWDEARVFVTGNVLAQGIHAPLLPNAALAFSSDIETDKLHVYIHAKSSYPYVAGMAL